MKFAGKVYNHLSGGEDIDVFFGGNADFAVGDADYFGKIVAFSLEGVIVGKFSFLKSE